MSMSSFDGALSRELMAVSSARGFCSWFQPVAISRCEPVSGAHAWQGERYDYGVQR